MDQTTVGRRLTTLEQSLGARLFERKADGFTLTPVGERLIELAQQIEQSSIDLERRASGADTRLEGVVRLATSETLSATFLTRQLASLHREHPAIEVQLITGTTSLNLLKREADLALRVGRRPTHQALVVRRLGGVPWAVFGSADYLARNPLQPPIGNLSGHDVVMLDEELAQIPSSVWLTERLHGANVTLRTNSILSAAEAVCGGWGLGALPMFLRDSRPDLILGYPLPMDPMDVWLVVHPDLQHTGRVRAVMDHLVQAINRSSLVAAAK